MADNQHPHSGRKFFDIARPGSVPENPTSKPVIVGHRPMQADPMLHRRRQELQPSMASNQASEDGAKPANELLTELGQEHNHEHEQDQVASESRDKVMPEVPEPETKPSEEQESHIDDGSLVVPALPLQPDTAKPADVQGRGSVDVDMNNDEPSKSPQLETEEQAAALLQSTGLTQPKKRRSGGRKILIIVLTLLVIGAVVLDLVLLKQYVDLR